MTMSRRDFGSFHSSNAEELINTPEEQYKSPDPPFDLPSFEQYATQAIQFGPASQKKHFFLEDESTFINHGAMGAVLKEAMEVAQKWQIHTERQPLRVVDRELIPQLVHSTRRLAKFVSALKKLLRHRCAETGAVIQEEIIQFPLAGKQQIIDLVKDKLEYGTKLAVFDHIPSNTPFVMPLEDIIPLCKERGVPVLVDGAHALGSLPLNLTDLKADYYTANAHKWLCAPKGCAFLYVRKDLQQNIYPCVVSHGFESGFHSRFIWQGLKDYSAFIALPTTLDFWEAVGADRIRAYINSLTKDAAFMLRTAWGTDMAGPADLFRSMCLIGLPAELYKTAGNVAYSKAEEIQNILFHRYNIEVPVKAVQGHLYVRISAHIYNQMSDYVTLADAVTELAKERTKLQETS